MPEKLQFAVWSALNCKDLRGFMINDGVFKAVTAEMC